MNEIISNPLTPTDAREAITRRLSEDLIGPFGGATECLWGKGKGEAYPTDTYLLGMLWPTSDALDNDEPDQEEDEDDTVDSHHINLSSSQKPRTLGLSFVCRPSTGSHDIDIDIHYGQYFPIKASMIWEMANCIAEESNKKALAKIFEFIKTYIPFDDPETKLSIEQSIITFIQKLQSQSKTKLSDSDTHIIWIRVPRFKKVAYKINPTGLQSLIDLNKILKLHVRTHKNKNVYLVTVTMINAINLGEDRFDRMKRECYTIHQAEINVSPLAGASIEKIFSDQFNLDEDAETAALLFRNREDFAVGHNVSVDWHITQEKKVNKIYTTWLPSYELPFVSNDGSHEFKDLLSGRALEANYLATRNKEDLIKVLNDFANTYEKWINNKRKKSQSLQQHFMAAAKKNLEYCTIALLRIRKAIILIDQNKNYLNAFRLSNKAMALQSSWNNKITSKVPKEFRWRPFQLGFILLASPSVCLSDGEWTEDRKILDLLWFPTGGGKTEAYLAIISLLLFYKRLSTSDSDSNQSVQAFMRYTLRLLTLQQFSRASSMILASDLLRKNKSLRNDIFNGELGNEPFSIGLWVGGDVTPNSRKDVTSLSQIDKIKDCPCCGHPLKWSISKDSPNIPKCEMQFCDLFFKEFGEMRIYTIDQDIYENRPSLLIATVDKFAQVATRAEVGQLFAFRTPNVPSLIIQDELHLITGPLGTIVGSYETALQWLMRFKGCSPKIIGSTATIRRASSQARAIFDQEIMQFPPSGIDQEDSGFAVDVSTDDMPGRLYLAIPTLGRSAKFTTQAIAASIMQSSFHLSSNSEKSLDGYFSLLSYFNSIRELGGAEFLMRDDVPKTINVLCSRRAETKRNINRIESLTSMKDDVSKNDIFNGLKIPLGEENVIDVCLSTNMISVGVDIDRLGIMLVVGVPKTRSEYIQASSRVGRSVHPGLVVTLFNAAKTRDRDHYEKFSSWHNKLYRDVEANSATPYSPRAIQRTLPAVIVSMIRHGIPECNKNPAIHNLSESSESILDEIKEWIIARASRIDPQESEQIRHEVEKIIQQWIDKYPKVTQYKTITNKDMDLSLLIDYDRWITNQSLFERKGLFPVMNNMRSVESTAPVKLKTNSASNPKPPNFIKPGNE